MDFHNKVSNYSLRNNEENLASVLSDLMDVPVLEVITKLFSAFEYCPWIFSLIGSILVALSGVFPLLVIPIEEGESLKSGAGAKRLRILLSFAVGGLLADVFLHLLPEAWDNQVKSGVKDSHPSLFCGLWVLAGMLIFVFVEKMFSNLQDKSIQDNNSSSQLSSKTNGFVNHNCDNNDRQIKDLAVNGNVQKSYCLNNNNNNNNNSTKFVETISKSEVAVKEHYHISGYLNLMANSIDNFTHGLAIGGSFCISFKLGVLSTFAILVHEIPHEVGDFAILLKSGFSRWDAAKAQIGTATAGIMGSMIAVVFGSADAIDSRTSWILPFTAGGFLHIALVSVLPDLIREESSLESLKQLASLVFGIAVMASLIVFFE